MKCLGIPNSRAFHGITKVEDARALWKKMNADKAEASGAADAGGGEQFEDRDGNVMSKQAYETLARQGLL
jgi:splicing factor 3A subunit 3